MHISPSSQNQSQKDWKSSAVNGAMEPSSGTLQNPRRNSEKWELFRPTTIFCHGILLRCTQAFDKCISIITERGVRLLGVEWLSGFINCGWFEVGDSPESPKAMTKKDQWARRSGLMGFILYQFWFSASQRNKIRTERSLSKWSSKFAACSNTPVVDVENATLELYPNRNTLAFGRCLGRKSGLLSHIVLFLSSAVHVFSA